MENKSFLRGVNFGGWLSQYDVNEESCFTQKEMERHFETFITESDFERVASWGADHIRLPFAAWIIENQEYPYALDEKGFFYLDKSIEWCEKYGLNLIIDLHEFRGHIYGLMDKIAPLLLDENLQVRFVKLWGEIAARYKSVSSPVIMFELMNEISDASGGYLWRKLYELTIKTIRNLDKERLILVGCNNGNCVFDIDSLQTIEDDNVWYNFHYYEPQVFTHQKAHFSEDMKIYNRNVHYPGRIENFIEFLSKYPEYCDKYRLMAIEQENNKRLLEKTLKNAINFIKYSGKTLYCGEYGVIDNADDIDRKNYLTDICDLLAKNSIGRAYWNYKEMDFGLVDKEGTLICDSKILSVLFDH